MKPPHFIACDWGTSRCRLRLFEDAVVTGVHSSDGCARIAATGGDRPSAYADALRRNLALLADRANRSLDNLPVLISGMASSSVGWQELPYATLPFALDGSRAVWQELNPVDSHRAILLSGVRGANEVMRGEETEAMGVARLLGDKFPSECVVLLPGTHAKHLHVRDRQIVDFQTYMTGELFDVLRRHSLLRHSTGVTIPEPGPEFIAGVKEARQTPLSAALFQVRTRQLLGRKDAAANTAFLQGLLIGAELAGLQRRVPLVLCATGEVREAYLAALHAFDRPTLIPEPASHASVWGQLVTWQHIGATQ